MEITVNKFAVLVPLTSEISIQNLHLGLELAHEKRIIICDTREAQEMQTIFALIHTSFF